MKKAKTTPKAKTATKTTKQAIELPANNAAQFAKSEELKTLLSGGKALSGAVKKIRAASSSKVRENFPGWLHLLPVTEGKALGFIWDSRQIVDVIDTSVLSEEDYIAKPKDSGAPLIIDGHQDAMDLIMAN